MFNKLKKFLKSKKAVGSIATAVKVVTACVLGATVLVGGVALTNDVVLPNTETKVVSVAAYQGDGVGGDSVGGVTPVDVTPEQSITDLTGTTWELIEYPEGISGSIDPGEWNINFVSNENTYSLLYTTDVFVYYDSTRVKALGPVFSSYRIVAITGGVDATNPDTIAWFEANATRIVE